MSFPPIVCLLSVFILLYVYNSAFGCDLHFVDKSWKVNNEIFWYDFKNHVGA